MICESLSENDLQFFAVIANGEFIKTNALPTTPEPSKWLDLVDQAAASILTWEFGAVLLVSVVACCAASFLCRRCQRNRRHKVLQSRYRRAINNNRGVANGRKLRPTPDAALGGASRGRPRPFAGPVRAPGEVYIAGSGRFEESWRRPGPASVGERSTRSMRSGHSARGALLTGAGAMVPTGLDTGPATPEQHEHETCPQCGLELPDAVSLVNHVEVQHGGRAVRRKGQTAAAAVSGLQAATVIPSKERTATAVPVVKSARLSSVSAAAPVKDSRKPLSSTPEERTSGTDTSRSSSKATTDSLNDSGHSSGVRDATAPGAAVTVSRAATAGAAAVGAAAVGATAVAASRKRSKSPGPRTSRSKSPPGAEISSGVQSQPRAGSAGGRSGGSGGSKSRSSSPGSSGRESLQRVKDASGHGSISARDGLQRAKDASAHGSADRESLPRLLPRARDASRRRESRQARSAGSGGTVTAASKLPESRAERQRGSGGLKGEGGANRTVSPPRGAVTGRAGSGDTGNRRAPRERSRTSAERGISSDRAEGRRSRGRTSGRTIAEAGQGPTGLVRESSTRSLARTASLDRMSALSSRALTRSNGLVGDDSGSSSEGEERSFKVGSGAAGARGAQGASHAEGSSSRAPGRRKIRRTASTEDYVPTGKRLTVDTLRTLGSGYAPPVFSPVKGSGREPAYSPVARERAGELDNHGPVSLTKKFFRQLSGDA